jgi:single-strand DNA-binding protein
MNNLSATGNIGKEATIRYTPNGDAVAQFSFALTSGYGDKQVTTWLNCSIWGKRAESLAPHLTRGAKVGITGELTNRPYTDKQGNEKHSLELRVNDLTLLSSKSDSNIPATENNAPQSSESVSTAKYNDGVKDAFDNFDDAPLPF